MTRPIAAPAIRWTYAFVDRPRHHFAEATAFWTAVTGTQLSEPRGEQLEFTTLLPDGADPCVKAQAVGGHGGAHLDLAVDDLPAAAAAAVALGAVQVDEQPGLVVLRSPGGLLFCLVRWRGEARRPDVVTGPDGSWSSRLDQLAVDVGPDAFPAEVAFWAGLTGWESLAGSRPEFHLVRPSAELPFRLLVHRLDADRPASAHLDLACSDVDAVRARHEQLGARTVGHGARWTVMRDPVGGVYCLTGRDPRTGNLPPS
jgi:hypothetical protein